MSDAQRDRLIELIAKGLWEEGAFNYFGGTPSWGPKDSDEWWARDFVENEPEYKRAWAIVIEVFGE